MDIVEAIHHIPAECISKRIVDELVDAPGPQLQEQIAEVVKIILMEQFVITTAPDVAAETLDVIKVSPKERSAERIVAQRVAQRAPKRRNMQRNRHRKQSVSDS